MLEKELKFFWEKENGVCVGYVTCHPPGRPPGGHPALSPNKINDLESMPPRSPPCSVIPILNIILLSIDIIGLLSTFIGLIWI